MNPTISNISEERDIYKFTLGGLNVSLANAVRRTILSDIPTVVIQTDTHEINQCNITENTSRLHNEILKQRLSCIPIHMGINELEMLPGKYQLEVEMENETDTVVYITTENFRIKNKENGNYLTREETRKIFPPNPRTQSYIDFARLNPKISDTIPGAKFKMTAEFSISTAKTSSAFNVVSKCAYGNTPDRVQVDKQWDAMEAKLKSQEVETSEIAFQKTNFYILDAQRHFVPDSYDFVVRTVGVYDNKDIVRKATEVLVAKFAELILALDSDTLEIRSSDTTMENSFDIVLENEDYTIGKALEFVLFDKFYMGDKSLSYCGFKKFHPHDAHSVIRLAMTQPADKTRVGQCLRMALNDAGDLFKRVGKLF
jgi:DNA-directed RNA polymerase alpha subunit/DNA-directed RNA polymerase subunit L